MESDRWVSLTHLLLILSKEEKCQHSSWSSFITPFWGIKWVKVFQDALRICSPWLLEEAKAASPETLTRIHLEPRQWRVPPWTDDSLLLGILSLRMPVFPLGIQQLLIWSFGQCLFYYILLSPFHVPSVVPRAGGRQWWARPSPRPQGIYSLFGTLFPTG